MRLEAEINRVRFECENKIEILSRNSCDLSFQHKYEKLFETKVNEFEDTVSNLKADMLKLRQENNSLKSKILLLENSSISVFVIVFVRMISVCENNNLAPVSATNIPDKTINTIVNERPSYLMVDYHIKTSINNEVSQTNKNSAIFTDTIEHLSDLNTSRSVCTKTPEAHKKSFTNSQVNSSVNSVEARNERKVNYLPNNGCNDNGLNGRVRRSNNDHVNSGSKQLPKQLPKHQTPCPFLEKRGFCLKGRSCDFLHQNSQPKNFPWQHSQNWRGSRLFPCIPQPNNYPFLENPSYFPPFHTLPFHTRPFSYPPPLMSIPTRSPVY